MIINSEDTRWDQYVDQLPKESRDIYFTEQYCRLYERMSGGAAELFVYEKDENIAIYPYIKRKIQDETLKETCYDIETPYGYGGPVAKKREEAFLHEFELAFLSYCQKENIIAEFIRFHPFLENEHFFAENIEVLHNRFTVWTDLNKTTDEIWMQELSSTCRNRIRKCEKNGLAVEISEDYDEFMDIYNQTMNKVGAGKFYFFEKRYYEEIKKNPNSVLMRVRQDNETLAAAVFMIFGDYFHYHLGGSKREFLALAPNNILMWAAMKFAREHGCKKMHFGGGLSDSKEDTLYRFKSTFSSTFTDFYIGKRIHNHDIYHKLIQNWEEKHGTPAKLLLQYREG